MATSSKVWVNAHFCACHLFFYKALPMRKFAWLASKYAKRRTIWFIDCAPQSIIRFRGTTYYTTNKDHIYNIISRNTRVFVSLLTCVWAMQEQQQQQKQQDRDTKGTKRRPRRGESIHDQSDISQYDEFHDQFFTSLLYTCATCRISVDTSHFLFSYFSSIFFFFSKIERSEEWEGKK